MMSAIKSGKISYSRFGAIAEKEEERLAKNKITVDRSGGGL
jgi:hypothetical protein